MVKNYISVFIVALLSCTNNATSKKEIKVRADLVQSEDSFTSKELFIDNGDEEGWGADIRLSIVKVERTDSSITFFANSHYKVKNIGFQITIPSSPPKNEKELAQLMTIASSGVISDNLIATLSELYKEKVDATLQFISSKQVAFIDLDEFAKVQLGQEPTNNNTVVKEMKLFFEAENPDDYAELYININETEHWLEIREKDEGYRKQVIKGFTTK